MYPRKTQLVRFTDNEDGWSMIVKTNITQEEANKAFFDEKYSEENLDYAQKLERYAEENDLFFENVEIEDMEI